METIEELNKALVEGKCTRAEQRMIIKKRKELMNRSFGYLPEQLECLRRTNEHLIHAATKVYQQICYLETCIPAIKKDNENDSFSEPYITGEVSTDGTVAMILCNEQTQEEEALWMPTEMLNNATLYTWEKDDSSRQKSLEAFLYQPFPQQAMERNDIEWKQLEDVAQWCYGMKELMFRTDFSLTDLMEKMLFGGKTRICIAKTIMIEDVLKNKKNPNTPHQFAQY